MYVRHFCGLPGCRTPPVSTPFTLRSREILKQTRRMIGYEAGYRTQVNGKIYLDLTAFYNKAIPACRLVQAFHSGLAHGACFLCPALRQHYRGPHVRRGNCSRLESYALVAGAGVLFLPGYVAQGRSQGTRI